jgi:hypothetical protein
MSNIKNLAHLIQGTSFKPWETKLDFGKLDSTGYTSIAIARLHKG